MLSTMEFTDNYGAAIYREHATHAVPYGLDRWDTATAVRGMSSPTWTSSISAATADGSASISPSAEYGRCTASISGPTTWQARYLRDYFGLDNAEFEVADAMSFDASPTNGMSSTSGSCTT